MKAGDLIIYDWNGDDPVFGIIIKDLGYHEKLGGLAVRVRWTDTLEASNEKVDVIMDPKEDWISLCE